MRSKMIIALVMTLAMLSCFIALAYAYTSSVTPLVNPIVPGQTQTSTFTTNSDSSKVTFKYYALYGPGSADDVLMDTHADIAIVAGSATDTYLIPGTGPLGGWEVRATGSNGDGDVRAFEVASFNVVPELPLIGTAGASIAMMGGLAYKMKRKKA